MSPVDAPERVDERTATAYRPPATARGADDGVAGASTTAEDAVADAGVPAPARVYIPGIGEPLPIGERLLWTGSPERRAIAREVGHVRGVVLYFGLLIAAVVVGAVTTPGPWFARALFPSLALAAMAATVLAFAHVYAALVARSSVYAITDRRVVFRIGVAIPAVLNVPLDRIESVDLRQGRDGTGDVTLTLGQGTRIAYLLLWPHARPWRLQQPEPTFRSVRGAEEAGALLAEAIGARLAALDAESGAHAVPPTIGGENGSARPAEEHAA